MTQYSDNVQALLTRIGDLQAQIKELQPIKLEQANRIFQKYRLEWNYNSNSIEGNSLDYGETVAFIMEGLTAKGKPLKDHLDIKGHNKAINFLLDMRKEGTELMERDIRSLHEMILVEPYQVKAQTADGQPTTKTIRLGVYKDSPNHVETSTGEVHYYATPEDTPAKMQELMAWYRENLNTMNPLVLSTLFHHRFVSIHPFDDGNGRMSRLLSNLILMQADFPPVVVLKAQRKEYYSVLNQADAGLTDPLLEYFAGLLIHSLDIYLRGARGENITESNDLDKEIALFIGSFDENEISKAPISEEILSKATSIVFKPFFDELMFYNQKIKQLFFDITVKPELHTWNGGTNEVVDFKSIDLDVLYRDSVESDMLTRACLDYYRKHELEDGQLQFYFPIKYSGFKANDNINPIIGGVLFIFAKSYYSVRIIANEAALETKKYYPKSLLKDEAQHLVAYFFRGLISQINAAVELEKKADF